MRNLITLLLILFPSIIYSQNIKRVEYFFDADPGFGNGLEIQVPATQEANLDLTLPVDGLEDGFHTLYIRALDEGGNWTTRFIHPFLKETLQEDTLPNVSMVEYFFDTDPGLGNGNPVDFMPADTLDLLFNADLSGISNGFHILHVRAKDENGNWGIPMHQPFLKESLQSNQLPDVVEAEYFIDTDPGYGLGAAIPIDTASSLVSLDFVAELPGIADGLHVFYLRVKDSDENWSLVHNASFEVCTSPSKPTIPAGDDNLCMNTGNTEYSISQTMNAVSYEWSISPMEAGTISGTDTIGTVDWSEAYSGTAEISVKGINSCSEGEFSDTLEANINPFPGITATPSGNANLCQNAENTLYTINRTDNAASYGWAISPMEAGSISGTDTIGTVDWSESYSGTAEISAKGINSCSEGEFSLPLPVTINPFPAMPPTPTGDTSLCQDAANTLYETSGAENATSYQWALSPTEAGTIDGSGTTATVDWAESFYGLAEITATGTNNCANGESSGILGVAVNAIPSIPQTPVGDTGLCTNSGNTMYTTTGAENAQSYEWQILPEDAGTITGTGTIGTVEWNTRFAGDAEITVKGTNQNCNGETSSLLAIQIDQPPVSTFAYEINGFEATFTNTSTNSTSYLWDFGDGETSTDENPVHTYAKFGDYEVILVASNEYCTEVADTQTIGIATVLPGIEIGKLARVYPNPSKGIVYVEPSSTSGNLYIKIIDSKAQVAYPKTNITANIQEINIKNQPKGLYIIKIWNNQYVVARKLLVN